MSPDKSDRYEPPEEFKNKLQEVLSKCLLLNINEPTQAIYMRMEKLLCQIESKFYEEESILKNNSKSSFKEKKDEEARNLKRFATQLIKEKLEEFEQQQKESLHNEDSDDWIRSGKKLDNVAKTIWNIRCYERKHCPRAGSTLYCCDPSGSIEILLTKYRKNDEIQYGFSKGKIEFGETIVSCAARETAEEIGLNVNAVYKQIENLMPIERNVINVTDNTSIKHFYYMIRVPNKNIHFTPNQREIEGVEWHDIFAVKCCKQCQGKKLLEPTYRLEKSNYFMVNCSDGSNNNSLVLDILKLIDNANGSTSATEKYKQMHKSCYSNQR